MKVIKHSEPWDWFEVHNFLSDEEFHSVRIYAENQDVHDTERTMHVLRSGYAYDIMATAMRELCKEIEFVITDEMEITIQLDAIEPDWAYDKVHSDNEKKLVTFVMAISDEGTGTHLYSKDRTTYVKTTNWIQNGGNGFIRKDDTWHDFDSKGLTDYRRTAIIMVAERGWDNV